MRVILFVSAIAFFVSSCALPRCKGRKCTVRMIHYHDGAEYRGVSLFKYHFVNKNPRYGFGYDVPLQDPSAIPAKKKESNIFTRITSKLKPKKN